MADQMKDLRRSLVADDTAEDAGALFAAEITAMRLEAVARGAATDHKWSISNRALVRAQADSRGAKVIGWLGGHRQWQEQGRAVREGAVPYEIWAPVTGAKAPATKGDDDVAPSGDTETGAGVRVAPSTASGGRVTSFRVVEVYDWAQTIRADGAYDPDWAPTIPGGSEAIYQRMVASSPLPVVEDQTRSITGIAHGWTDDRRIVIDGTRSVGTRISTLAHERAHVAMGHLSKIESGEMTRAEAEQEAGLVGYLVTRGLDLGDDTDTAATAGASAYLRHWVGGGGKPVAGHKARWRLLADRVGPATDVAHTILVEVLGIGAAAKEEKRVA